MQINLWAGILGLIVLIGGASTIVVLLSKLMAKAGKEALQQNDINNLKVELKNYVRTEVFDAVKKDMEGIGRKLGHLEMDQRDLNNKYLKLEGEIVTELKNASASIKELKDLFMQHLNNHNGG